MSNPNAVQLEAAKRVVRSAMKTRGAQRLFNKPVDPIQDNVPDYLDVISNPVDLDTIHKRLVNGHKHDWGVESFYASSEDVFADVERVWHNCYLYNNGPKDGWVREHCRLTQQYFEKKWREDGLPRRSLSNEMEIPERFSAKKETAELPVRLLDRFCLFLGADVGSYVALDEVSAETISEVHARGVLLPADDVTGERFDVCLGGVVEWSLQYGPHPGIWLITHHAWYKLLNPHEAYVPYVSGTIQKFMTTLSYINAPHRTAASAVSNGETDPEDSLSIPDDVVDLLFEDDSLREEILARKRSRPSSRNCKTDHQNPELGADSAPSNFSQDPEDSSPRSEKAPVHKLHTGHRTLRGHRTKPRGTHPAKGLDRSVTVKLGGRDKALNRKKPRLQSPPPAAEVSLSELDEDDPLFDPGRDADITLKEDEDDEDYVHESSRRQRPKKVGESEAQRVRREKKAQEQLKRDQEADRKRGAPPPVTCSFRIPQELVGMALSCWDFLITFRVKLEIPAFPFWRFEAALCPKYHDLRRSEIKHALERDPSQGAKDAESKASALLLQDVHVALCRVLQGKTPFTKDAPTHAAMEAKAPSTVHWTQSTSLFLIKSALDDDETRAVATFMHGHEYLDLTVRGRLKILCALIDMVVSTEAFRDHLNGSVDKLSVQKLQPYEEKPPNTTVLESVSLSFERRAAALSAEKWTLWFLAHRVGVLSTLGQDFRGTHYWVLGAESGCYRLYVEHRSSYEASMASVSGRSRHRGRKADGVFWGWYEGEAIAQFAEWLEKGELETEKPLLEALHHIPKPVQLERNRSHSDNTTLTIIGLGYHKMDRAMLEVFRMDDYVDIRYPLLRGEGEITEAPADAGPHSRVLSCVRALLSAIPFWQRDTAIGPHISAIIKILAGSKDAVECSRQVCQMMELVADNAKVREEWKILRRSWEMQLLHAASFHSIMAHLALFQSFVLSPAHSVHRPAFNVMVQDAKCPLYFPLPSEEVVVLKTGCLAHLKRYQEVSRQMLATPTVSPCFRESLHPEAVTAAQESVELLSPVEHFTVCCIAYRSPYQDAPPEGTPLAEDGAIPVLPCMWMLLCSDEQDTSVILPIHVDNALPDYIVKVSAFEQSRRTNWKAGDRFKMFFGGKSLTRGASGIYYKGIISSVKQAAQGEAYDPWESLTVEWDNDHSGASMKVSPWEIEVDPEEQKKLEESRMRQMESRARQARVLAKHHRTEFVADEMMDMDEAQSMGDPDYDPLADAEGGKSSGRPRRRGSALQELVYYDPKRPSGPVPPEMMAIVPGPYEFPILIHNFMQRLKGKFKCPVFSGKELDLYKVFHEVQQRGGYDVVTSVKLWKDVCRTLNVNLEGQTSASYNMRLNYEKCLLDFEHYLSSGRYSQELKDGTAPSCTVYEPYPQKLRGVELEATRGAVSGPNEGDQMMTRGARRHRTVSMTQLLMGENSGAEWGPGLKVTLPMQKRSESERVISPLKYKKMISGAERPSAMPPVMQGSIGEFQNSKKLPTSRGDRIEIQPGESIGMAMDRLGWALIGCRVWRRCPGQHDWCRAEVTGFSRLKNEHCLVYDKGRPTEQCEWVDLRELEGEELSQVDPLPAAKTVEAAKQKTAKPAVQEESELSRLLTPPPALQRFRTETAPESITSLSAAAKSGMDPTDWLQQVLSSGSPELMKRFVGDDAVHKMYEEATRDNLASLPSQGQLHPPSSIGPLASFLSDREARPNLRPEPPRSQSGRVLKPPIPKTE